MTLSPELARDILALHRTVHEPARLLILLLLREEGEIAFTRLEELSGLTRGNLASHLKVLTAAAYMTARQERRGRRPTTLYQLTRRGRTALEEHLARLRRLLAAAKI